MKPLIVTVAAAILAVSIFQWQFQLDDVLRQRQRLQFEADAAAAAAGIRLELADGAVTEADLTAAQKLAAQSLERNLDGTQPWEWQMQCRAQDGGWAVELELSQPASAETDGTSALTVIGHYVVQ